MVREDDEASTLRGNLGLAIPENAHRKKETRDIARQLVEPQLTAV